MDASRSIGYGPMKRLNMYLAERNVSAIGSLLEDQISPSVKKAAMEALASFGCEEAVELLGSMIQKAVPGLSDHALELLMKVPGEKAVDAMAKGLAAPDPSFRSWVLYSLANRLEPAALQWIIKTASEENNPVNPIARRILSRISVDPVRLKQLDEGAVARILELTTAGPGKGMDPFQRIQAYKQQANLTALQAFLNESLSPRLQTAAIDALVSLGTTEALEAVGGMLEGGGAEIAEKAMQSLAVVPGDEAVRALARGLRSPKPDFRSWIMSVLFRRKEASALKWIAGCLDDEHPHLRKRAEEYLKDSLKDPERLAGLDEKTIDRIFKCFELEHIIHFLEEDYPAPLRLGVIRSMGRLEGRKLARILVSIILKEDKRFREAALSSLEKMQRLSAGLLFPLLRAKDPETRRRGLILCGRCSIRPKEAAPIKALLKDPDASVRREALVILCSIMGEDALDHICFLIGDSDRGVRGALVDYFCGLADQRAIPFLSLAALDQDKDISKKAVFSLASRGIWEPAMEDLIVETLKEELQQTSLSGEQADLAADMIELISQAQSRKGLEAIVAAAHSYSIRIRRVAAESLDRYPLSERLDALAALSDTDDKSILKKVALGLGEARDPRAIIPLIRAIEECGGKVGRQARAFLDQQPKSRDISFLIEALKMRWPSVKKFAAKQMEDTVTPMAIGPLLEAMEDEDVEVQLAVVQALSKFVDQPAVSKRLIDTIGYGDLSVRQKAIEVLGEARVEEALEPLIRALGNRFLRSRAEEALRNIGLRKGILAIKRRKIREKLFPKKPQRTMEIFGAAGERKATASAY